MWQTTTTDGFILVPQSLVPSPERCVRPKAQIAMQRGPKQGTTGVTYNHVRPFAPARVAQDTICTPAFQAPCKPLAGQHHVYNSELPR